MGRRILYPNPFVTWKITNFSELSAQKDIVASVDSWYTGFKAYMEKNFLEGRYKSNLLYKYLCESTNITIGWTVKEGRKVFISGSVGSLEEWIIH